LLTAQMMSKPACTSFPEAQDRPPGVADSSQPGWPCRYKK
jgi:hypothetical protein